MSARIRFYEDGLAWLNGDRWVTRRGPIDAALLARVGLEATMAERTRLRLSDDALYDKLHHGRPAMRVRIYRPNGLEWFAAIRDPVERKRCWQRAFWHWTLPVRIDPADPTRPVVELEGRGGWANVGRAWFRPVRRERRPRRAKP